MIVNYKNRRAWLKARQNGVGASEAAALFNASPWQSAFSLWAAKVNPETIDATETPAMHWGKQIEALLAKEFAQKTGYVVGNPGKYTIQVDDLCPQMFATLDRIYNVESRIGVLEIKNARVGDAWGKDTQDPDSVPLHYQIQVQQQMACSGLSEARLAVLIGGNDFRIYEVPRNENFISALRERVAEFWAMVETKTPPVADGSEATTKALKALHPNDSGETVELPHDIVILDEELLLAKECVNDKQGRISEIENQIKAYMGAATYAQGRGFKYSYKTQERKETIQKASTFRVLRRQEEKS